MIVPYVHQDPQAPYWNKMELTEDDKFLKNYILNKQYLEEDEDRFVL